MILRAALVSLAVALLAPAAAFASLADEQNQGHRLLGQLQSGATSCGELSADDFDHIGEYLMGRTLGSTSAHQAMNERMRLMLGGQGEQRMHQLMGQRFAGCTATGSGGAVMGPGMMSSGDYRWMMGGNWRTMSRQDWQRLQQQWPGMTTTRHHGWSPWAIVAVTLAGVLVAALVVVAVTRRPFRRPPSATSA